MKTKVIRFYNYEEALLKIVVGNLDDFLSVVYSCTPEEARKQASPEELAKDKKAFGVTGKIKDGLKDPDRAVLIVWINMPLIERAIEVRGDNKINPYDVLLHELIHVKQRVETKYHKGGEEPWPHEDEAYYLVDLYQRARTILD